MFSRISNFFNRYHLWHKYAIKMIRSGAQTGVDWGALDAALYLYVPICGWVPKNRLARKPIPDKYFPMLIEMTEEKFSSLCGVTDDLEIYRQRTEQNVKDGDGTLIIMQKKSEYCGGTQYTHEMANKHQKPCLIFNISEQLNIDIIIHWIIDNDIHDLNVGGPNEEKSPGAYHATFELVKQILLHPKLKYHQEQEKKQVHTRSELKKLSC